MEETTEFGIRLDNFGNVLITAGYDTVWGHLHFPLMSFSDWNDFENFVKMLIEFKNKYGTKIPKAFTNAFNGEK